MTNKQPSFYTSSLIAFDVHSSAMTRSIKFIICNFPWQLRMAIVRSAVHHIAQLCASTAEFRNQSNAPTLDHMEIENQ